MSEYVFTAISTIASVVIGGFISLSTTAFFEKRTLKSKNLAIAYSVVFKVQHFVNELLQLQNLLTESIKRAEADGADGPMWTKIDDLVGFSQNYQSVTSEELALIAQTKNVSLVMDLRELESGHTIALAMVRKIEELRNQLRLENLATGVDGRTVSFEARTPEQAAKVAPILINLNDLSKALEGMLPNIVDHARHTANKLGQDIKNYYKFKHFVMMKIPA